MIELVKNSIIIFLLILGFPISSEACTVFNVSRNGSLLIGRNFDYFRIGGEIRFIPASSSKYAVMLIEQYGRHMPFEGINDQGLFIAMAFVPPTKVKHQLFKAKSNQIK